MQLRKQKYKQVSIDLIFVSVFASLLGCSRPALARLLANVDDFVEAVLFGIVENVV